jgi:hypothetical protein
MDLRTWLDSLQAAGLGFNQQQLSQLLTEFDGPAAEASAVDLSTWSSRLRMPDFGYSAEQLSAYVAAFGMPLTMQKPSPPSISRRPRTPNETYAGYHLVTLSKSDRVALCSGGEAAFYRKEIPWRIFALVAESTAPVESRELSKLFWPDEHPLLALNNVYRHVYAANRVLSDIGLCLCAKTDGYSLVAK